MAKKTEYAHKSEIYVDKENENSMWWLRTPGSHSLSMVEVCSSGRIFKYGVRIDDNYDGVRPALWLNV